MPAHKVSRLESLPTEILVLALSAVADSPPDLLSLICTSSTIYKCFQSFKVAILTAPAFHDLGPGILDAIAISRIPALSQEPRRNRDHGPLHEEVVIDYIRQHHKSTSSTSGETDQDNLRWTVREITPKMAESILHLNTAVQFFVDLYVATRLSYLRNQISWLTEKIDHPPTPETDDGEVLPDPATLAAQRSTFQALHKAMLLQDDSSPRFTKDPNRIISRLERQRLATAFLRAQLLVTLSRPNVTTTELQNVRLNGRPFASQQPPPGYQQPTLEPSSATSLSHWKLMELYPAWELEQISQAHYFTFVLCEQVVRSQSHWVRVWGGATGPWLMDIRTARRMASRVWMTGITLECQFDMIKFRARLIKGGAKACLGDSRHDHRGCLWAKAFDSVRRGRRRVEEEFSEHTSSDTGRVVSGAKSIAGHLEEPAGDGSSFYEPKPVPPVNRVWHHTPVMRDTSPCHSLPVSREFHGRWGRGDGAQGVTDDGEDDENDGIMPTFGPGPGSPSNVRQVECHMGLRLLLSRGEGTWRGSCMATAGTNCHWLTASHRYKVPQSEDAYGWPPPGRPEAPEIPVDDGDDESRRPSFPVPYAWTDALNGLKWDRWGLDFAPVPESARHIPRGVNPPQTIVDCRVARWRWFGLAFWDQERVGAIKAALEEYETGWLNTIW